MLLRVSVVESSCDGGNYDDVDYDDDGNVWYNSCNEFVTVARRKSLKRLQVFFPDN